MARCRTSSVFDFSDLYDGFSWTKYIFSPCDESHCIIYRKVHYLWFSDPQNFERGNPKMAVSTAVN